MDFRSAFSVLLLAGGFLACQRAPSALFDSDVDAIKALDDAYVEAVVARNWDGLGALLTEDGVVLPPNESPVIGRAANTTRFKSFGTSPLEYAHGEVNVGGAGHIGYVQGTSTISITGPGAEESFVDTGKYLWVVKKQPTGAWLIDKIIWNSSRRIASP